MFIRRAVAELQEGSGTMLTIPGPIILDLNTQRDLLSPDGVYPVFQADKLAEPLKKLFTFAHRNQIPVISTRFNQLLAPGAAGSGPTKLICNPNTTGYQKMSFTNLR